MPGENNVYKVWYTESLIHTGMSTAKCHIKHSCSYDVAYQSHACRSPGPLTNQPVVLEQAIPFVWLGAMPKNLPQVLHSYSGSFGDAGPLGFCYVLPPLFFWVIPLFPLLFSVLFHLLIYQIPRTATLTFPNHLYLYLLFAFTPFFALWLGTFDPVACILDCTHVCTSDWSPFG